MTEKIKQILQKIKGEPHLSRILNSKIVKPLINKNLSLYDIYHLKDDDFIKMRGVGNGKIEYLNEFRKQVNQDPTYFENYETYVLDEPIVIGQTNHNEESLAIHIDKCLIEIYKLLKFKSTLPSWFFDKVEYNSYLSLSNYMDDYFGINNAELLTFQEIGKKYQKTSELIRTTLFDKKKVDLCTLFNSKPCLGLKVDFDLTESVKTILSNNLYNNSVINILTNNKQFNPIKLNRIVEIFDYELIETKLENDNTVSYTLVKNKETLLYRYHLKMIDTIFIQNASLTKDQFIEQIQKSKHSIHQQTIDKKGINNAMIDALFTSYKFETIQKDNVTYYQFKWQYLSTILHKISRILQEKKNEMSKEEILVEYNSRERVLGNKPIDIKDFHIKQTDKIKPIGKLKWVHSEYAQITTQEPIVEFISRNIISQFKGKIAFEQFKKFIEDSPYSFYSESTLRTYLLLCCRKSIDDNNLFIHQDFLDFYSTIRTHEKRNRFLGNMIINITVDIIRKTTEKQIDKAKLKKRTLEKLKGEGLVIKNISNYNSYINNFTELGVLIKKETNNVIYYSIDEVKLNDHDLTKLGKKSEPEYKKNITAGAISFLKSNKKIKLSDLKKEFYYLIPKGISDSNFYKIFEKDIFIREKIGSQRWVSLQTSLLPVPQDLHTEVQEESKELLGQTPITERVRYKISQLKEAIVKELYSECRFYKMDECLLSKSFDILLNALSDENGKLSKWGDSLLQSVYELLCTKTDYYDRETCVNKLITGYETFLKCFVDRTQTIHFTGLADVINYLKPISELRNYKNVENNNQNIQLKNFSYILSKIKFLSDKSRHDKMHESLDMGFNTQIKNTIDFIALYLYSGYLIKKEE